MNAQCVAESTSLFFMSSPVRRSAGSLMYEAGKLLSPGFVTIIK